MTKLQQIAWCSQSCAALDLRLLNMPISKGCHGQWGNILKYACAIWHPTRVCSRPSPVPYSVPISSGTKLFYTQMISSLFILSVSRRISLLYRGTSCRLSNGLWLTFNTSKCNYMILSRKRVPATPLLSSNLSWTPHTTSICSKAKWILGLLYRRFSNYAEGDALKQQLLYFSLVDHIWNTHVQYGTHIQ